MPTPKKAKTKKTPPRKTVSKRRVRKKRPIERPRVKARRGRARGAKRKTAAKVVLSRRAGNSRGARKKPLFKIKRRKVSRRRLLVRRRSRHGSSVGTTMTKRGKGKYKPIVKIKVVGVGGGGGNALTRMSRDPLRGVEFVAVNTDIQDLESCEARRKIHIGKTITHGFGAGMNPELGQQSAEENRDEIEAVLQGTDMVFLTAGLGGGTGTGATPVIADIARDMGILTVAVVTKPFAFEGSVRARIADEGLAKLRDRVDTLLVIPNDRIFNIIDTNTPVLKAFDKIDEILKNSVRGIAEMIAASGLVNVDFADVGAVMKDAGMAVVGVGVARGKDRAVKAVHEAVNSPLLDISIDGARGVLFSVAGGRDLKMSEINEAARIITENVDAGAKIIFGAHYDRRLRRGDLKIILIATGFDGAHRFARGQDALDIFSAGDEGEIETMDSDREYELAGAGEKKAPKARGKRRIAEGEELEAGEKEKEEMWEIPAFLRRRRKR